MSNVVHLVVRTDDNGNVFPVRDGLTREEAERLCSCLAASAHKQHYDAIPYEAGHLHAVLLRLGARGG